jgi:hypothetical protein
MLIHYPRASLVNAHSKLYTWFGQAGDTSIRSLHSFMHPFIHSTGISSGPKMGSRLGKEMLDSKDRNCVLVTAACVGVTTAPDTYQVHS